MKWYKSLSGVTSPFLMNLPVYGGGANIEEGAVVVKGATPGTDQGFAIIPSDLTGNLTNVLGVISTQHVNTSAGADSKQDGTAYTTKPVTVSPDSIYLADYSQATGDRLTVTSTSGTTVTIGSLEDNIDGGWLYCVAGTGAGRLAYITTSAAGSCTTKEVTGWDNTSKVIKILPKFHENAILSSNGRSLGTQAAVGGTGYIIWENMIEADSIPIQALDPVKHSGLTGLSTLNLRLYAQVWFQAYVGNI